jgi:DNA-binding GntR family transcriptional regulator
MPLYLVIQNALRVAIGNGTYAPGDRLPTEAELAQQFATTKATVVHALQQLVFEGMIERRRGLGSFVAQPAVDTTLDTHNLAYFERDVFASGKDLVYKVMSFGQAPVEDHVREALRLAAEQPVFELQRIRVLAGQPFAYERRYMPAAVASGMTEAMLARQPVQDILEHHMHMPIAKFVNAVRVSLPPADIARHLDIERARPVLVRTHTFLDKRDVPLLWGETAYREEYKIHYVLTRDSAAEVIAPRKRRSQK